MCVCVCVFTELIDVHANVDIFIHLIMSLSRTHGPQEGNRTSGLDQLLFNSDDILTVFCMTRAAPHLSILDCSIMF